MRYSPAENTVLAFLSTMQMIQIAMLVTVSTSVGTGDAPWWALPVVGLVMVLLTYLRFDLEDDVTEHALRRVRRLKPKAPTPAASAPETVKSEAPVPC